jgi:hypothetical protein
MADLPDTDSALPVLISEAIYGYTAGITNAAPQGTEQALIVRNIPSGTQTVTGTVTANIGNEPIPVLSSSSGGLTINGTVAVSNFPANQTVSGTVSVNQPITVLSSSASGITVNGTITANVVQPLTVLSSSASGVTINGSVSISNFPATQAVTVSGQPIQVQAATLAGLTVDVSNFPAIQTVQAATSNGITINGTVTANVNQPITVLSSSSGGLTVNLTGTPTVSVTQPLTILASSASGVTVNGNGNFTVVQTSGANLHADIDNTVTVQAATSGGLTINGSVSISNFPSTVTVSNLSTAVQMFEAASASGVTINGSVTANQGTPNTVANAWPIEVTNGTSIAAITNANPLGTEQALIVRNIPSGTQPVSGTITANAGTGNFTVVQANPANLNANVQALSASGVTINGTVTAVQSGTWNVRDTGPVTVLSSSASGITINGTVTANVNQPITVLSSSASGLTVNGSVSVSNFPSTVTISNTPIPVTESGTWNVGLNAGTNNIGNVNVQAISAGGLTVNGSVSVSNFPSTVTVSNLSTAVQQFQAASASGVTVNGTVSVTQPIQVLASSATGITTNVASSTTTSDKTTTGTITALNGNVALSTQGCSSIVITTTGTWVATLTFQGFDGTNWITASGLTIPLGGITTAVTINGSTLINCGGFQQIRVIATAFTSGTANIFINAGAGTSLVEVYNNTAANLNATVVQTNPANLQASVEALSASGLTTNVTSIVTASDKTGSGTITALNGSVAVATNGCSSVAFNVTGTWVATITIQATVDGVNWQTTNGNIVALDTTTQFFSTNAFLVVPCGGFSQVRLTATAFTSGTVAIAYNAGEGTNVIPVFNNVAAAFQTTATQGTAAAVTAGWPITGGQTAESTAAWTSATALNTTLALTITGYNTVAITLNQGTTLTGGAVTFEASDTVAGTNWYVIGATETNNYTSVNSYTFVASTNQAFTTDVTGFVQFRVRLSTVITGTGTVNVGIAANAMTAVPDIVVGQSTAASLNATVVQATAANLNANVVLTSVTASANLAVTATGAAAAAVTATLPAPGAGLFHFITAIEISMFYTAAGTAAATPILVTTTNFAAATVFSFDASAAAEGTISRYILTPFVPIQSSVANTATTIVCPASTAKIWRVNVFYYTAT